MLVCGETESETCAFCCCGAARARVSSGGSSVGFRRVSLSSPRLENDLDYTREKFD
jgi:hypothetical protein